MTPETAPAADPAARNKKTRARDVESWPTLKRFLPYLWPKDNTPLRRRIVIAMTLVLAAKAVTLALPFAYKGAVDAMAGTASEGLTVALALVAAYALGRFTSVAFDNLRNIAFERVGQVASLHLEPGLASTLELGESNGALAGIVSGSGPTVAFLAADRDSALELQVALSASGIRAVRATGPVHGARIVGD